MAKQVILSNGERLGEELSSEAKDELDERIFRYVSELAASAPDRPINVVDIGGAYGDLAYRLCKLNKNIIVTIIDRLDTSDYEIRFFNSLLPRPSGREAIVRKIMDAQSIDRNAFSEPVDVVISRRVLHFLHPEDSSKVIQRAWNILPPGGQMFISFTCVPEERNLAYFAKPLDQRFVLDEDDPTVNVRRMVYKNSEAAALFTELRGQMHLFENGTQGSNRNTIMIHFEKSRSVGDMLSARTDFIL